MTPPVRPSQGRKPILPHGWAELQPLLDTLLDAEPAEREGLLSKLTAEDPAGRAQLEHLLAECERDVPMLGATAVERFDHLVNETPPPELSGTLGGRYRIQRELGHGGMARVYLAEDLKHGRDVAVKVIRAELAASLGRDRFLREIGIAARLRHPNIMPLFDSGDAAGTLYFVMPYESGPSLRTRLDAGPALPMAEALSTLRDVAKALAYAHEQGVVHRDVKPDNVMLSGDTAVVTDFGIAKAVSAARGDAEGTAITRSGVSMGTPAYMAPEQAVGDPATDHRADIYSFGCLAYELLAGAPPFVGETYQVISAHMRTVPKLISETRTDVPAAISQLVQRCLEKDPAARPQQAQELLDALATGAVGGGAAAPGARARLLRAAAGIGAVALVLAGGAFFYRRSPDGVGATATAARMLVVLPMENRTGDSAQTYLATGLAENIARRLEGIGGIKIRSGARSEWPTTTRPDLEMLGRALGSTYLLKTILHKSGDSLDLRASVVNLTTTAEKAIARRRFTTSELRSVEADMAARIAAAIFRAALPTDPNPTAKPPDPESYRLTLEGWHIFLGGGQHARARDVFNRAIALDPSNARAWSGLSSAWYASSPGGLDPEVNEQAETAAQRALALDPMQGSAWANLGYIRANREGRYKGGMALIEEGIKRDPGNAEVYLLKAALFRNAARWDDSRDALRIAKQMDPYSPNYVRIDASNEMCAGQFSTALQLLESLLARAPTDSAALSGKVRALAAMGRFDDAISAWRNDPSLIRNRPLADKLRTARGASGYWDARHLQGKQRLASLEEKAKTGSVPRPRASMLAQFAAGDFEPAFRELERIANGPTEDKMYRLPCGAEYDEVRGSSRFAAIQKRMGSMPE